MKVNDVHNFMIELGIEEPVSKDSEDIVKLKQDKIKSMTFCRRADKW